MMLKTLVTLLLMSLSTLNFAQAETSKTVFYSSNEGTDFQVRTTSDNNTPNVPFKYGLGKSKYSKMCSSCHGDEHKWLDTSRHQTAILCGQDAVQFHYTNKTPNLCNIAKNLSYFGSVTENKWLVRTEVEPGIIISVFADGRLIVAGTREPSRARSVVSKYIGM